MTMTVRDIRALTEPGLNTIMLDFHDLPEEWKEIYSIHKSTKMQEYDIEFKALGPAVIKSEAGSYAEDTMGQRYLTTFLNQYVGLSFSLTRQAIDDNLYETQFPHTAKNLKRSLRIAKNISGASILNNGFNSAYPIADGKSLLNATHPTDSISYSNTSTTQFSEAGIEEASIGIQSFPDLAGNLLGVNAKKMVVPTALQFSAVRITKSALRAGTTNNDMNAMKYLDTIPSGTVVNKYLTNSAAYFILTDLDDCFKHFIKDKIRIESHADFMTDVVTYKAVERYCFGVNNAKGLWGGGFAPF